MEKNLENIAAIGRSLSAAEIAEMMREVREFRDQSFRALIESPSIDLLQEHMSRLDSETRPAAYLEVSAALFDDTSDIRFWSWLSKVWPMFDRIPHDAYRREFKRRRRAWTLDCLSQAEQQRYIELPTRTTIFRGQSRYRRLGLSWTLNPEVARDFARGHRNIPVIGPVICRSVVIRRSIAMVLHGRGEEEVVLFAPPLGHVDVKPVATNAEQ